MARLGIGYAWVLRCASVPGLACACAGTAPPEVPPRQPTLVVAPSAEPEEKPHGNVPLPGACEPLEPQEARFSHDGSLLAVSYGSELATYASADWSKLSQVRVGATPLGFQLSSEGRFVFLATQGGSDSGDPPGEAFVLDAKTGKAIWRSAAVQPAQGGDPFVVAADASWFAVVVPDAVATEAQHVELVSLPDLKPLARLEAPTQFAQLKRPTWRRRALPPPRQVAGMSLQLPNDPPDWSADKVDLDRSVARLRASPDSKHLLVGWQGNAGATSLVDARAAKALVNLPGHDGVFSPAGRFLVLSEPSGAIALHDTRTQRSGLFYDPLCQPNGVMAHPSFSPDESLVVFGGAQFRSCLAETIGAKPRGLIPPKPPERAAFEDEGFVLPGAWASDGSALLMAMSIAGNLELFQVGPSRLVPVGDGLRADSPLADNSSSYPAVVRRAKDESLVVFNQSGHPGVEIVGSQINDLSLGSGEFALFAVSPDGEAYVRSDEQPLLVRSTRTGAPISKLARARELNLSFDPTGRYLYQADATGVRVWDVKTGERRLALRSCAE